MADPVPAPRASIVTLESQPIHIQRQQYRIFDAKSGLLEEGWVNVSDMRERLPWLDENWGNFRVEVTYRAPTAEAEGEQPDKAPAPA